MFLAGLLALVPATRVAATDAAFYRVRPGDNLSLIAARFGTTVARLRTDNTLPSDVIHAGQELRLVAPFARATDPPALWRRPVASSGPVLRPFGPYKAGGIVMRRTGTELACPPGTAIVAPAVGVVRWSGVMEGYGHLVIVAHPGNYATVLGPCDPSRPIARVGQAVLPGDALGHVAGPSDPGTASFVHLELRRGDQAVPPDRLHR